MDVRADGPHEVGSLVFLSASGDWTLTVVAKATFQLAPELSPLLPTGGDPLLEIAPQGQVAGTPKDLPGSLARLQQQAQGTQGLHPDLPVGIVQQAPQHMDHARIRHADLPQGRGRVASHEAVLGVGFPEQRAQAEAPGLVQQMEQHGNQGGLGQLARQLHARVPFLPGGTHQGRPRPVDQIGPLLGGGGQAR